MSSKQFSYGGQAVIEGVMMRGAHKAAIAVRDPNGKIHVREEDLNQTLYRGWVAKTPFVRGLVGLWDAMGLGTKALLWSADIALIEGSYYRVEHNGQPAWVLHTPHAMKIDGDLDTVPTLKNAKNKDLPAENTLALNITHKTKILAKPEPKADVLGEATSGESLTVTGFKPEPNDGDIFSGTAATLMVIVSLAIGIGIFFVLPTAASSGIGEFLGLESAGTNIVEEVVKMAIFLGYILLIGQMEDVKRLFRYHGAEHKTINAYEAQDELIPQNVQGYPIEHPRCGTAFLLNVIIISIIVNTLIGRFDNNLLLLIPARIITVPIVAGIAYEWLRWTAKNLENPLVRFLIIPNMMLQRLTTNPPDDDMVEVAIVALERVLVSEGIIDGEPLENNEKVILTDAAPA